MTQADGTTSSPKAVGDISCIMARYPSAGYKDTREDEVGLSGPTQAWLLGPEEFKESSYLASTSFKLTYHVSLYCT